MTTSGLFESVSAKDHLGVMRGADPRVQRVVELLDLSKKDLQRVTGIGKGSIRYDARTPKELLDRAREWANLLNLVAEYFRGDVDKTLLWFKLPNPLLGDLSPRDFIRAGRYAKVLRFVLNARAENER